VGDAGGLANVGEVEQTYTDGSAQVKELTKDDGVMCTTCLSTALIGDRSFLLASRHCLSDDFEGPYWTKLSVMPVGG
jgi:hypothetical protein